ncbi:hypothetical protein VPH35_011801 [Triticum aestivum]
MALTKFNDYAEVLSNINACHQFFSWMASGIITAMRYRRNTPESPDEENAAAQRQIQEEIEQLDTKLRQLKNCLWKLKTTMPKMLDLIDKVEWQSHKEKAAVLLPDIKDAVYDAEDLLDEFDYYALKLKVECSKKLGQDHLHGTFLEFLDGVGSNDYIRKVDDIQVKLDHVNRQAKDMGLHQAELKFDKSVRPETSSFFNEPKIFGREEELKQLVETLGVKSTRKRGAEANARMTELPVLPIVGIGGIGKTTMAQQICNDSKVKEHFDLIIWTCASDDFDIKRLTREIIEHLGKDASSNNLDFLMRKLENCIKSKKFLLVVDDMWDDILKDDGAGWKRLCAPLTNGSEGSRILITTRSPEVANVVGPTNHYKLKGLQDGVFREFFKLCAFGSPASASFCHNRESLEGIGEKILPKLKGSPLAAKTIGRLLRMDLSTSHWETIVESELWQLEQTATDILPVLRLSYMYLPQKLKRCFSICALYPKDHKFEKGFLADIWTAQGYVVGPQEASLCFDALANRAFFQRASHRSELYVIHDLLHDTAQLVSKDECFIIKHASDLDKVPSNVRHLSIFTNGKITCSELKSICNKKSLRSLVCNESYSAAKDFAPVIDDWFKELLKIRVFSFKLSKVKKLPESMGNSKHLRYLGLLGGSTFSTLPSSVCRLHHLKTIDADGCVFERFPPGFSDAIILQKIKSKKFTYDRDQSDKLCLEWSDQGTSRMTVEMMENQMEALPHCNLRHLHVHGYGGESFPSWLRPKLLPRLSALQFSVCRKIKSIPFLFLSEGEGSLNYTTGSDISSRLEELIIRACDEIDWQSLVVLPTSLTKIDLYSSGYSMDHFVRSFRDLTSLTVLKIQTCKSLTSIPLHLWSSNLPTLEKLHIMSCDSLISISVSGASSSSSNGVKCLSFLSEVYIGCCNALLSLDEFLTTDYLPVVKIILVRNCQELTSLSVDQLYRLQELEIFDCPKLNPQRVMSFPSSLKKLHLSGCEGLKLIDIDNSQSGSSPALEKLRISSCPGLRSIGDATVVSKIKFVVIRDCGELQGIRLPFRRG